LDAMPTFLGLLAVPGLALPPDQPSGRDVLAPGAVAAPILSQDTGREHDRPYRYALTDGRWKYFRIEASDGSVRDALYDRAVDPFELEDVAADHAAQVAAWRRLVELRVAQQHARGQMLRGERPPATRPLDRETRDELRALGYATGEGPPEDASP